MPAAAVVALRVLPRPRRSVKRAMQITQVTALIRQPDGRILMLYSPTGKTWALPGGPVQSDETTHTALERIVNEQTGLVAYFSKLGSVHLDLTGGSLVCGFQVMRFTGDLRIDPTIRFFTPADARSHIDHPASRLQFDDLARGQPGLPFRSYQTGPFRMIWSDRI